MASRTLPWTARDIFALSLRNLLAFEGSIAFHRLTQQWRYPVPTSGDLETMTRRDIIYWLYKAQFPVERAVRGSGLEALFDEQAKIHWELPAGFEVQAQLRMSAAGDLMDHTFLAESGGALYEAVADLVLGADVSMANLECVVYPKGTASFTMDFTQGKSEPPPLYYGRSAFHAAKGHEGRCYSFLSAASNHSLDCGEEGVHSTIRELRAAGIAFHGLNESEEDSNRATIFETRGFKLGLCSHTFGLNAKKPPEGKPWIVNRAHLNGSPSAVDLTRLERQVQHCRQAGVDFVVAQLHWGLEHEYYPRPVQLEMSHHLAEMGCDLIVGHHPHVVQPVEYYRPQRDKGRIVPIYYSLGNLINPFSHPAFRVGGVAQIDLVKGLRQDGTIATYVKRSELTKTFQEIDEKRRRIRLVPAPASA